MKSDGWWHFACGDVCWTEDQFFLVPGWLCLLRFCFLKGQGKGSEEVLHFLSCLFENYIFKLVFHLSFLYFFSCLFEDYILILLYFLSCLFEDYIFKFVFLLYIFSAAYLRMQAVITQLVILCIGQFTAYCSVSPVEGLQAKCTISKANQNPFESIKLNSWLLTVWDIWSWSRARTEKIIWSLLLKLEQAIFLLRGVSPWEIDRSWGRNPNPILPFNETTLEPWWLVWLCI